MGILQDLKDKVMGTEEQNKAAEERMKKQDAKDPDTTQAKVNRAIDVIKPTKDPVKKMAKGGTASSRADGCAIRGKTRA